jgi:hypothetical protein
MYLDFPSAALLAGLPYLLTPPAVGKVAVRNDIVSTGVSVAFIQQATVGVIHVSFVTHSGKRRCMSNTCTVNYRRDGLLEAASFDDAWGGCLIGDPGDDTTRLLSACRIVAHRLNSYCVIISSFRARQHGYEQSKDSDLFDGLVWLPSVMCPHTCSIRNHPRHLRQKDETDWLRCCIFEAWSHGVKWFQQIRHPALVCTGITGLFNRRKGICWLHSRAYCSTTPPRPSKTCDTAQS